MRNCIVNMQQVQLVIDNHVHHSTGQGSFVRLIIDQWIGCYPHFVIEYICIIFSEPYWLLICNEVYLMAFICQRFPEFRGKDTTSSKCRITNNSNAHLLIILNEVKQISELHI